MTYTRKTKDEWYIEGYYNHEYGWEEVFCADNRAEAIKNLKAYLENEPYPFRIKKRRVRIENTNQS